MPLPINTPSVLHGKTVEWEWLVIWETYEKKESTTGELKEKPVVSILEITAEDGKKYFTKFYNMEKKRVK